LLRIKKRLFQILQPSEGDDLASKFIDLLLITLIFMNIGIVYAYTFPLSPPMLSLFQLVEQISIVTFTVEYFLRLWTADLLYPNKHPLKAKLSYMLSWIAIVDLFSILPYYLPMVFPVSLIVLRVIRLTRLFQIFKLTRYVLSMRSIWAVIRRKASQLVSSIVVIFMLITIVSLIMYSVENPAQPEVFRNGFSGMWWAIATLTTVGYGDIYPITAFGKVLAAIISILGIGFVAVPTAIISSGFIQQIEEKEEVCAAERFQYCPHCGKKLIGKDETL